MDGGRSNYSGRGRGRGGGRRGGYEEQGGRRGRGDGQNQGGGRGWNGSNRGSHQQPPAQPQWVSRPEAPVNQPQSQPVWGVRPPSQQQPPAQPQWVSRPQASVNQPPSQPVWGVRPPSQQPQQVGVGPSSGRGNSWTGRPWGSSSSTAAPVQAPPSSPAPAPAPSKPAASVGVGGQSRAITEKPSSSSAQRKEGQIQPIRRPDHGTLAVRKVNIMVNHFPIDFNKQGTIYHYDVDVKPVASDGSPLPMKKPLRKSDLRFIRDGAFPNSDLLKSVYDGEKNIFSAVPLKEGKFKVDVSEGEDLRSGTYMFTIKLVNELKLSKLHDYLSGSLPSVPRDTLQGLDLVMKENPMRRTIPLGSRSFFTARNAADLGGGLAALKGFQPSLKPTGQGLALCLDYSVLAFRKPMAVFDYLREHLNGFRGANDVMRMRREISKALKGLKVKVTHRKTNQKYTIVGLTDDVTRDIYFELVDREGIAPPQKTRLVDYFREKWGKEIRDQGIPCLDVGKPKKPNAVPIEFCVLVEGQRFPKEELDRDTAVYLKNLTLVKPWERCRSISDMVRAGDGPYGDVAKNFDLILDMNMTKVEGRVIGAPELKVGGSRPVRVDPEKCQWNLLGKSFVDAKSIDRWALLDFTDRDKFKLQTDAFVNNLRGRCRNLGIQMAPPLVYRLTRMNDLASVDRLERLLQEATDECMRKSKGKLQLIVCAMTKRDPGYKYLKWVSETKIGVVTQCLLSSNANKGQDQYLANLCLKINAKLGGTNFEVSGKMLHFNPSEHVMFIGADVNHPAPMNKECPSIAAVVGTVNFPAANRYAARVSPQTHRCETIKNFGEMCSHLITAYARNNRVRPKRIVVFRDGVSEGQFEMVLGEELLDLKKSIYTDDYRPPITVIVAQKRHQTRLFPEGKADGGPTGNVPPGTVVDTKIVHPHDFDFYLCSHYGGIGTSKPTHYYVLHDENGFKSDHLQKLIYDMCFTFVRCTKPVSLVPPVYYADLVAYRGRMFQEVAMESDGRSVSSSSGSPSFDSSFYSLHSDLENMMFFV